MVLLLDNYDSFTYNVAQYAAEEGADLIVKRNDQVSVDEIDEMDLAGILISPGPCTPQKAGISIDLVKRVMGRVPIFGVCLGMQAIAVALGGRIQPAKRMMHGKASTITHDEAGLFEGLPSPLEAIRYHSLGVDPDSLPGDLVVTATAEDGEVMGIRDARSKLAGVQFHPESILTEHGKPMVRNWLASL